MQAIVELAVRVTVDDSGENVGEVAHRLDAVELADFDQRSDDRPVLGSRAGADAARILGTAHHDHAQLRRDDVEPPAYMFANPVQAWQR